MMGIKLVTKFMNGDVLKGQSEDFLLLRETFHIRGEFNSDKEEEVRLSDIKAVFFVGSYGGNSGYNENKEAKRPSYHRRLLVRFHDGEEIVGYCDDDLDQSDVVRLVPADPVSNNTLIFIVRKNAVSIELLEE